MKKKLTLITLILSFLLFGFFGFYGCKDKEELKIEKNETIASGLDKTPKTRAGDGYGYTTPEDKYKFPDISGMNDWSRPNIIQERIDALQMPEGVLATISTAGLLETCLEFPYLLDILHFNDFQQGFNCLVKNFNGFREILKRPDLPPALINKYYGMGIDIKELPALSLVEQGMFSFRHFVLEFMLAQDVVINNLNEAQEEALFLLTMERKELLNSYPEIFSAMHKAPTALLYAKKMTNDNQVRADMKNAVSAFIQAPMLVNKDVINYLNDYINVKFK